MIDKVGIKKIMFSDGVLLNQLYNELPSSLGLSKDDKVFLQSIGMRMDQLEWKSNVSLYKKEFGLDILYETIQAIKFYSFESKIEVEKYNPVRNGYLSLIDFEIEGQKKTIALKNKLDYLLPSGTQLNRYEEVRRK